MRLGLAALEGKPLPETTPAELAEDLRSEFPTDPVALKLADALSKQGGPLDILRAKFDALGSSLLEGFGSLVASFARMGSKLDGLASSLGTVLATLATFGGKLDAMDGKLDRVESTLATVAITVNDVDAKSDVASFCQRNTQLIHPMITPEIHLPLTCQPTPERAEARMSSSAVG